MITPLETSHEIVHTTPGWYDGPRKGIANYEGRPHLYESMWDQRGGGCWTVLFMLMPLDAEAFELAVEDWQIWQRWEKAFRAGQTTRQTQPALPEDKQRHEELRPLLSERLKMQPQQAFLKRGHFEFTRDPHNAADVIETAQWFSTDETAEGLLTYSELTGFAE